MGMQNNMPTDFGCPLPAQAVFYWSNPQDWDRRALDEEEQWIKTSVLKRQREFRAGRNTARRCIAKLTTSGASSTNYQHLTRKPISVGDSREPLWPKGIVGSISHSQFESHDSHSAREFCGVVVAFEKHIKSIGIDIERIEHLSADSLDLIITQNEWQRAKEHCWPTYWPKYIFAAKESFYKCCYPLTGAYLDFLEADFHLKAVKSLPGVYEVEVVSIDSREIQFSQQELLKYKGYVYGDHEVIRAVFWLES